MRSLRQLLGCLLLAIVLVGQLSLLAVSTLAAPASPQSEAQAVIIRRTGESTPEASPTVQPPTPEPTQQPTELPTSPATEEPTVVPPTDIPPTTEVPPVTATVEPPTTTPTPSEEATFTETPLPSETSTDVLTLTAVVTVFTETPSATATGTSTNTATATATSTLTSTSTFTATSTATFTPTATATLTATPFPPTDSLSNTPTATNTHTSTPVTSVTFTPTFTPTTTQIAPDCDFSIPNGLVYGANGLVEAITAANLTPELDVICLTPGGLYSLDHPIDGANGLPIITSVVEIRGGSATISRVRTVSGFRLMSVNTAGNLILHNLTLANGQAAFGGAIFSSGILSLTQVTITNSLALSDGGGIYANNGIVTLNSSFLLFNDAILGGALYSVGSATTINISGSQINDNVATNFGGGIFNFSATLNINNSQLLRNQAEQGGAVRNQVSGTMVMKGSKISENRADISGGGLLIDSPATIGNNNCFDDNDAPMGSEVHYTDVSAVVLLDFQNNWWGSPTGATEPDQILGEIDYLPFLATPPIACSVIP